MLDATALLSEDPAWLSEVDELCCGPPDCCLGDSVVAEWFSLCSAVDSRMHGSLEGDVFFSFLGGVLFFGFILIESSSEVRRESGGVIRLADAG